MKKTIDPRLLVLVVITMIAGVWRLFYNTTSLPLLNFTPIGAMALFGGCYFGNKSKAYFFPLATLFLSDLVMMFTMYPEYRSGLLYEGWYIVYGTFALMVFIGNTVIKTVNVTNVVLSALVAALAHWVITDFGVWMAGGLDITTGKPYTKDWAGLARCYINALPYLRSMLAGNLIYSALFFGAFELLQKKFPVLRKQFS